MLSSKLSHQYRLYYEEFKLKTDKLESQVMTLNNDLKIAYNDLNESKKDMERTESRLATMERENKSLRMFGANYHPSKPAAITSINSNLMSDLQDNIKKDSAAINQNTLREMMVKTKHIRQINTSNIGQSPEPKITPRMY